MSAEGTALYFKYDHNGLRTQKIVQRDWYPVTTNYLLHGKLFTHMTVNYHDWEENEQQDVLHFFYDAQSRPTKVDFNGTVYTYVHNLQGDIVGILDSNGNLVVEYKYDAWGRMFGTGGTLANTLGKLNPFRYRGYVYEQDLEIYYLKSRFYNPDLCRFSNSDMYVSTGQGFVGNNMFAYGSNDPIDFLDCWGNASIWYYLSLYNDWGYVHRMVQKNITDEYPTLMKEVYLEGHGRADLVDASTHEVWEIKHGGKEPVFRTIIAVLQAYAYVGGRSDKKNKEAEVLYLGCSRVFYGAFNVSFGTGKNRNVYEVIYLSTAPGAILYWVSGPLDPDTPAEYSYETRKETSKETTKQYTRSVSWGPSIAWGLSGLAIPVMFGVGWRNNLAVPRNALI